jgi:hypothetical protein
VISYTNLYARVVPRVRFESELELREVCEALLSAYTELVHRVVMQKLRVRGISPLAWTELDRLMFGIMTFDELLDEGVPLVLATTKGNGALYAHDLNARIIRCINKHNIIFFHDAKLVSESDLRGSLAELLVRVIVSASHSHYHAMLDENFERFVAFDAHEWLVTPRHRVEEHVYAIVEAVAKHGLQEDLVECVLRLLGLRR